MIRVGNVLRVHANDNVVIAASSLKKGAIIEDQNQKITLLSDIPMGHKIATCDIKAGENVIRYGNPIGHAVEDIPQGQYVHTHNIKTNLSDIIEYHYQPNFNPIEVKGDMPTFEGYRRPDGRVGIRNEIWVIPTVFCANGPVQKIVELANQKYPRTENFDGFYALTHPNGCSQMDQDLLNTQRILANLAKHPNAGGVLLVSLGCEVNNLDAFLPVLGKFDSQRIKSMICQEEEDEIVTGMGLIDELYAYAASFKRETRPLSDLILAVNCGGSDGFSGITANAVVGRVTDIITGFEGTVIMTEVPEMFGAEHILMNRAANEEVFRKLVDMINDYKQYFKKYDQVIYDNPTQGNKAGGISTLEEKSLGCTQKGGQAIVTDVLKYGETIKAKGFNLISGPGNDLVGITNQEAAGAVVTVFTTGRGTPAGFAVPLIRVGSNNAVSNRKNNWIDYNAGALLEGKDLDQAAQELLALILDVASGKKQSLAEANGYRQIGMLRDGVTN
ncbi:MAG TPA: altronate dehydratase family protein [Syntrophomonadaceae bacterium]|nr:altronate dehydratase family protein [Syntrophomonadaceae bacterium]HQE23432.1 altronate dehydratase family protein [Syntrophomonadaceae bacterium]